MNFDFSDDQLAIRDAVEASAPTSAPTTGSRATATGAGRANSATPSRAAAGSA